MNKTLGTIIAIVVVGVGAYLLFGNNKVSAPETQQSNNTSTSTNQNTDVQNGEATIKMIATGFDPGQVTIKKGTKVTFVNQDTKSRWPASAPHPTHTDYPEFDPKVAISAGSSWSFVFDKTGTWKFHDHLSPTMFGSVTVVE